MILRRFGQAIKRQDWLVVFIELMIVVVGIFIGLQVDDWNKARQDRNLEVRYLERIDTDLVVDLSRLNGSIASAESRIDRAYFLLAAAEDESLIYDDPTYFIESIEYAGYTHSPVLADHTFEEIKASGRLLTIRNEELRKNLAAHYDSFENRDQFEFIRQDFQLKYLELSFGILAPDHQIAMARIEDRLVFSRKDAGVVYERMMTRPEFLEWVPRAIQSKLRIAEIYKTYLTNVEELRAQIAEELGRKGT